MSKKYQQISEALIESDAVILLTGAGMGADSGIPTYRGEDGSWGQLEGEKMGNIFDIMTPAHLEQDPVYMWQRFARRIQLFDQIIPHAGHDIILKWIQKYHLEYFCVTSNVDAQLQKAGFLPENILEVHGNIYNSQCSVPCGQHIWTTFISLDLQNPYVSKDRLPKCPECGALARPNCLIFRDKNFVRKKLKMQQENWHNFLELQSHKKLFVMEIGAGKTIASIRKISESFLGKEKAFVLRINPEKDFLEAPNMVLQEKALSAILGIDDYCKQHQITKKNYRTY